MPETPMMESQSLEDNFLIRWSDHGKEVSTNFKDLRRKSLFFDVTLCCDNGLDRVQAHKLVLASCSTFFRRVLETISDVDRPVIYLKGVNKAELEAVLNFMYRGQVRVAQDSLNIFLCVAEDLEVKGLVSRGGFSGGGRTPPSVKQDDEAKRSFNHSKGAAKRKSKGGAAATAATITLAANKVSSPSSSQIHHQPFGGSSSTQVTFTLVGGGADGGALKEDGVGNCDEFGDEASDSDGAGGVYRAGFDGVKNGRSGKRSSVRILPPGQDRWRPYEDKRRYRKEWEIDHPWLTKHSFLDKAFCMACQKPIPLKKDKIHRHSLSTTHINLMNASPNPLGKINAEKVKVASTSEETVDTVLHVEAIQVVEAKAEALTVHPIEEIAASANIVQAAEEAIAAATGQGEEVQICMEA